MKAFVGIIVYFLLGLSSIVFAVSPEVTGLVPATIIQGYFFNDQQPLTINGRNFVLISTVEIGTDSIVYFSSAESDTTIEVWALISSYEAAGSSEVVITNASGEQGSGWLNVVTPEAGPTFETSINGTAYQPPVAGIPSTEVSAEGFTASFNIYASSAPLSWSLSRLSLIINGTSYPISSSNFTQITSTSAVVTCEVTPSTPFTQGATLLGTFYAQDNYGNAGSESLVLGVWEDAGGGSAGPGGRGKSIHDSKQNCPVYIKPKPRPEDPTKNRSYYRPGKEDFDFQLKLADSNLYVGEQGVRILGIKANGQKIIDYAVPGSFTSKKSVT
ncbi:MAG: hypothetical protein QME05_04935, partial [Candidatus Margulisbacteria bacterium]|nr:hypothetical protein [Candidatus Margulisiibacteriota bacterium]